MSKRLSAAIAKGKVAVQNRTSGEVRVFIITEEGTRKAIDVRPFGTMELAPKMTSLRMIKKSPNLKTLLKGPLRII